jgi:hypothetical protein
MADEGSWGSSHYSRPWRGIVHSLSAEQLDLPLEGDRRSESIRALWVGTGLHSHLQCLCLLLRKPP